MAIVFRNYTSEFGFTDDYNKVRDFLVRINKDKVVTPNFLWGRWEWMFSLSYMDKSALSKIGIWEDDNKMVALITYEDASDYAFFCVDPEFKHLKNDMLIYAKNHLVKDGRLHVIIDDNDRDFQKIAIEHGFRPTQDKQCTAMIDIVERMGYQLPEGFSMKSLDEECDLYKFNRCLYRGFNHGDDVPVSDEIILERRNSVSGPHLKRNLNIVVVAPNGDYASYCGIWYDESTKHALVEPVCTDPGYRMMGCGKAAVLEAVIRCGKLGAKQAYVGSSQQFYYNIGFSPISTETWWELAE
jgi:N-acetylglutamate synthase-like GNAT family acetyltransferase